MLLFVQLKKMPNRRPTLSPELQEEIQSINNDLHAPGGPTKETFIRLFDFLARDEVLKTFDDEHIKRITRIVHKIQIITHVWRNQSAHQIIKQEPDISPLQQRRQQSQQRQERKRRRQLCAIFK